MNDTKELTELASSLAIRLKNQAEKWVDAFYQEHYKCQEIRDREKFNVEAVLPIVTAFQVVHVMSFLNSNKYIEENQMPTFINVIIESSLWFS
jgi:hypothetical protein